jgi:hypothetical protein
MKNTLNKIDKKFEALRKSIYTELKPVIKKKALDLKIDCFSSQYSFSTKNDENRKFELFQDFLYTLSDVYHIEYYFKVENGKFTWL